MCVIYMYFSIFVSSYEKKGTLILNFDNVIAINGTCGVPSLMEK